MRTKLLPAGCFLGLALGALTAVNAATTWRVATDGIDAEDRGTSWDDPLATISYAVGEASGGDTIVVSNGLYEVTAATTIDKNLTIESLNGAAYTILDGGGENSGSYRAFSTGSGSPSITLRGLTISNFYVIGSGTISVSGGATWHIHDCRITGNHVTGNGGGIYVAASSPLYVYGTEISSNTAAADGSWEGGGGLWAINNAFVEIDDCRIVGNQTAARGGGIGLFSASSMNAHFKLRNSFITGNVAGRDGGGVAANGQDATISGCTIENNSSLASSHGGGGMKLWGGTVENSLIANNTSNGRGGGLTLNNEAHVRNCTVVHNVSHHIYPRAGINASRTPSVTSLIINTIVYFNKTGAGGTSNYGTHSNNDGIYFIRGITTPDPANSGQGEECIAADPELDAEFKPRRGISPAINAGLYQDWMDDATDLAGNSRILQGAVDIGAYEYVPIPTLIMAR